jgi:hypothetical protein
MSQLQKLTLAFALIACIASPRMALAEDVKGTVRLVMLAKVLTPVTIFLMTTDVHEQTVLAKDGWDTRDHEDPIYVFNGQVAGTVPLWRYSNPSNQDHFFTTNRREGDIATVKFGYVAEGVCCWVSATQQANTTPLWRLLAGTNHYYTASETEKDDLVRRLGWKLEGNEGFVWTGPVVLPPEATR